jgi:hypothetical protein
MDVFTEDQTSGQTNIKQTNNATRNLIEVDLPVFFHVQASEFTEPATSVTTQQQTMRFVDSGVVDEITAPPLGPYQPDSDDTGGLGDFLSRPVLINAFDWLESNVALEQLTFNPWTLFFSDPGIRRKLENYSRLRCKLHVKFVYNASPFYFGSMRVCYFPLREKQGITRAIDQIRVSQAPGLYIEPQRGTTSSMELPFLWPGSWIDLANMADCTAMGSMHYVRFAGLRSANGVATAKVRISCYAWATDVELAGPTTFTVQSTEYDETGPVSGPASAVASLAGSLEAVPVIGPFATATRIGAEAVSSVARVFGFTNPPVIDDVAPMAPKAFHAFSNVDTRMPIDKLTLDPKNEVTIDNSAVGASSDDELNLRHLITRESFLSGAAWNESQLEGAQLFAAAVSPGYALSTVIGAGGTLTTARGWTTGGYFAQFFDRWRGSVNYRFKFIKSKYHTGRVIISWDPQGIPGVDAETLTFSRLVDLQEEDDVIITIPFKARTPWLIQAARDAPFTNGASPLVGFDKALHNGVFRVYVQNTLTGPAAAAEITMLVYTSCGTDCVFSVPKPLDSRYTFAQQAAEVVDIVPDSITSSPAPWEDATEIITVGESIRSMRQILHRANWLEVGPVGLPWQDWDIAAPLFRGSVGLKSAATLFPRVPVAFGKHPSGTSYSLKADDPSKYTAASQTRTPVLSFVLNCFVGYRGAMVHHINVLSNGCDFVDSISATRTSRQWITTADKAIRNGVVCEYDPWAYNMTNFLSGNIPSAVPVERHENFQGGSTVTNQRTQASTSVLMPYYSQWKFRPAWEFTRDVYPSDPTSNEYESLRLTATFRKPTEGGASEPWPMYEHYCAAGPDFNVVYFVCTPITYIKNVSIVFNVNVWTPPV